MLSIEFSIRIGREQTPTPEPPAVYDTTPAHLELGGHDYQYDDGDDRQRVGFTAQKGV